MTVYLDNAATTLIKPRSVIRASSGAMSALGSPGRGGHKYAMAAAETAFSCREAAAKLFNVDDVEKVVFTFNATHGLNIAIKTLAKPGDRVIVSGYEHNAVMRPLYEIGEDVAVVRSRLFDAEEITENLKKELESGAKLVVWNHVSNVFGFVQPIDEIAAICRDASVPLIIDASQSAGTVKLDFKALGADFIAMPGHKGLYGPQGSGLLLCGRMIKPLISGGTGSNSAEYAMPDFLPDAAEAGTHNMPGIAGLLEGIKFVSRHGPENILFHEKRLIRELAAGLKRIKGVTVYDIVDNERMSGVLSFTIDGMESERAGQELARRGIAVRAGLHCAPEAHKTAGTFPVGTVRASVSVFNTRQEVMYTVKAVEEICRSR